MRAKTRGYLALGAAGLLAITLTLAGQESLSGRAEGILMGLGSMTAALGFVGFFYGRFEEKHPKEKRKNEIETMDERNREIRLRARALAGQALQWSAIAFAWGNIFLDGPLWVTLWAVGLFCGKVLLEAVLTGYYSRRM